jgi:hypothetical protein
MPRYWVDRQEVDRRFPSQRWFFVFRDVTGSVANVRSAVATIIGRAGISNKAPIITFIGATARRHAVFLANFNSFLFDYLVRQKLTGLSLNFFILKQIPAIPLMGYAKLADGIIPEAEDWICSRVLELTYTAWDLQDFAVDCGYSGPPFVWDEDRRFQVRCELDALYFHLYGISRAGLSDVIEGFSIVRRRDEGAYGEYRTKRVILEIYDAMAEAERTGVPYQTRLDPPPADPRVAHPSIAEVTEQL